MNQEITHNGLQEYFDHIAEKTEKPPYRRHFTSGEVISDGLKIHLDIYEYHPKAPNIVFIPGTAIYSLCYAEVMYKLGQQGYNIIGVDPRGHGRSEGKRGDYTIMEIMKDVENTIELVSKRFNDKISLMGSSQGGIVAFYLAAKNAKVQSVICQNFADLTSLDTTGLTRRPGLTSFLKPIVLTVSGLLSEQQIPISTYLDLEKIKIKYFGNAKRFIDIDPLANKSISLRALRSLATTELAQPLESIEIPVMVFQGTNDSIFPISFTKKIFDQLECKKKMELYEGMNHAILSENPDIVIPSVTQWLKEIYPEGD